MPSMYYACAIEEKLYFVRNSLTSSEIEGADNLPILRVVCHQLAFFPLTEMPL